MEKFEKEDRYLVVKYKDIQKYLTEEESGKMFKLVNSLFERKFKVMKMNLMLKKFGN